MKQTQLNNPGGSLKLPLLSVLGVFCLASLSLAKEGSFNISLKLPTSLKSGQKSAGAVVLSAPAPEGGLTVNLSSSDSGVVTVGHDIHFNKGQRGKEFSLQAGSPANDSSATIGASAGSASASGVINVAGNALKLRRLVLPERIIGGQSGDGQVGLSGKAPDGGLLIGLSSDNAALTGDGSVTVAAGQDGGHFHWSSTVVNAAVNANFTATWNGQTLTRKVQILPGLLARLVLDPRQLIGGASGKGFVSLYGKAGASGAQVNLSSDNVAVTVPNSVSIGANGDGKVFDFQTSAVQAVTVVHVTASFNGATKSAEVTVKPGSTEPSAKLALLALGDHPITGGGAVFGGVALDRSAPAGGANVGLQASDPCLQVPASVLVPAGEHGKRFVAPSSGVASDTTVTVTASYNNVSLSGTVLVKAAVLSRIGSDPRSLVGGNSGHLYIGLEGVAAAGGATVSLSSDSSSVQLPSTVTIPEGKSFVVAEFSTSAVDESKLMTITASYNGNSKSFVLKLNHN